MKDQFVTYEIAKRLKELGFNERCMAGYSVEGIFLEKQKPINSITLDGACAAPLWQQAIDWLRETRNIYIYINPFNEMLNFEPVVMFKWAIKDKCIAKEFSTYYQAREAAILKAIELIEKV